MANFTVAPSKYCANREEFPGRKTFGNFKEAYFDVTDKIERSSTFIGQYGWENQRFWPRKVLKHKELWSIFRGFPIHPRLPVETFVGDVYFLLKISFD